MAAAVEGLVRRLHPQRIRRTLGAASCVSASAAFAAAELRGAPVVRAYRLRGSGQVAHVRHPLIDMWGLEEIFRFRVYDPPDPVRRVLRALEQPPRIVDIGANVGFFALFARELFPEASVISFEPDPGNARLLRRCIEANRLEPSWRLVEGCASTHQGTVEFLSSYHLSRSGTHAEEELAAMQQRIGRALPFLKETPLLHFKRLEVPALDVFPFLADVDLVKIDAEGVEWELLADPRVESLDAAAIVLEYHPSYGPGVRAEETVRRALETAGYELSASVPTGDAAMVWAWKR